LKIPDAIVDSFISVVYIVALLAIILAIPVSILVFLYYVVDLIFALASSEIFVRLAILAVLLLNLNQLRKNRKRK